MTAMQHVAAATAITVTIEEMDKVIQRGFRALHPRKETAPWGEILYILTPEEDEPHNVIRVQTSIFSGSGTARGEGEDSIRITIINTKTNKPIAGKMQRVHRVQNWKDNLRSRIEDAIEKFEELQEERAKAKALMEQREHQQTFQRERPQEAQSERVRQLQMLEALARSTSPNARAFEDMLGRLRRFGGLLTDRQLAWAEREYSRYGRR
jgi:hypothetical protein